MMDSKQIEIEWMKELLKENELEIWRLRKEIKNLKVERDNFMLKYAKAVEEKVVETNKLCTERNKIGEENETLKAIIDNNDLEQKADWEHIEELEEENQRLKDRIDVLFEFIERNDKLVDEVIDEEDLNKLNRYIYIDDDLVDRALESED